MTAAAAIVEFVSGLAKNFPVTMTGIALVGGLALGQLAWMWMGIMSFAVILVCMAFHFTFGSYFPNSKDFSLLQACSIVPSNVSSSSTYFFIPSMWVAVTTFYLTYILYNAGTVYNTPAKKLPQEALPVQHRRSIGMVSIVATILLFIGLLTFRLRTGCEHFTYILTIPIPFGALFGILLGGVLASFYYAFRLGGDTLSTDVHGVLSGLQPGSLRDHPLVCAPQKA